jgi:hypothetical protein
MNGLVVEGKRVLERLRALEVEHPLYDVSHFHAIVEWAVRQNDSIQVSTSLPQSAHLTEARVHQPDPH